jgi:hypothetical protein
LSEDTRVYAARPILISGDCKRETGGEHAEVIKTILEAVDSKKYMTHLRVVSVASDGETRRGSSLVMLTFKHKLPAHSVIYSLISPLHFMNLHVGDDDLTCDKDWKHVFKRFRNLLLRARGIVVQGVRITPAILRSHLQSAGLSTAHLHMLFNPNDKQDVKLAFDMLKDIWSLPPAPDLPTSTPGFVTAREALRTLGKFLYHTVFPYLCVDLTLSEQLEHLSAAAHLALVLYSQSSKEFLPTLLYTDLMIMIKNVFFCVAKTKVDSPEGSFWLMLLGTDRLEELFGILRTMVGNDANLDILQLVGRLTGTTEVSNILAKYPHWDRSPRRLKLPAITRESCELPDRADHIKPASWRGNASIKNVTLLTCWKRGRRLVEEECAFTAKLLRALDMKPNVDILSPFGDLLVTIPLEDDDNEGDGLPPPLPTRSAGVVVASMSREIEDAIAEEDVDDERDGAAAAVRVFDKFVTFSGKKISKTRALALRSKYNKTTSSTDRLKRVQEIERYSGSQTGTPRTHDVVQFDSAFGGPCLLIQEPIATLVHCDNKIFLCIGEVNNLKLDGQFVEQVNLDMLVEDLVAVSFQMLKLIPATSDDDPDLKYDWRTCSMQELTFSVPGRLIQPIDPAVSTKTPGDPFYLLESSVLLAFSASLFERLTMKDLKVIPKVKLTREFPYREASGMSFVFPAYGLRCVFGFDRKGMFCLPDRRK